MLTSCTYVSLMRTVNCSCAPSHNTSACTCYSTLVHFYYMYLTCAHTHTHKHARTHARTHTLMSLQVWPCVVCEVLHQPKQEHKDAEQHEQARNEPQLHMNVAVYVRTAIQRMAMGQTLLGQLWCKQREIGPAQSIFRLPTDLYRSECKRAPQYNSLSQ